MPTVYESGLSSYKGGGRLLWRSLLHSIQRPHSKPQRHSYPNQAYERSHGPYLHCPTSTILDILDTSSQAIQSHDCMTDIFAEVQHHCQASVSTWAVVPDEGRAPIKVYSSISGLCEEHFCQVNFSILWIIFNLLQSLTTAHIKT